MQGISCTRLLHSHLPEMMKTLENESVITTQARPMQQLCKTSTLVSRMKKAQPIIQNYSRSMQCQSRGQGKQRKQRLEVSMGRTIESSTSRTYQ